MINYLVLLCIFLVASVAGESESSESLRSAYAKARQSGESVWLNHLDSCYVYLYKGGGEPKQNLASFDLDGTLIRPKSNRVISRSAADWQFLSAETRPRLHQVIEENDARFVIFTNQNGVGRGYVKLEEVQRRIELVMSELDLPGVAFVAIGRDKFRKPETGMFKLFEESFNAAIKVDLGRSLFCGDAIGYPNFSDSDIKFAEKVRIPFQPPAEFLSGAKPRLVCAVRPN